MSETTPQPTAPLAGEPLASREIPKTSSTGPGGGVLRPSGEEWALLAVAAVVMAPAFAAMHGEWSTRDYYGHGYFVPLVAAWVATAHRDALARLPAQQDGRGLVAVVLALLLHAFGLVTGEAALQGTALVALVAGSLWWRRGLPWLRQLMFPVAYLLFMVPIPEPWIAPLIVALQTFVTNVSVGVLQAFDVTVSQNGNVIDIPGGESLFVAEACSGITSLVTLLPIAAIVAYFSERRLVRRLALIATVVPLAMLGNGIRVIATVIAAIQWGAETATKGPLHDYTGLATYALGCLALLAVAAGMQRFLPDRSTRPA